MPIYSTVQWGQLPDEVSFEIAKTRPIRIIIFLISTKYKTGLDNRYIQF